jgi:hypothetical protein
VKAWRHYCAYKNSCDTNATQFEFHKERLEETDSNSDSDSEAFWRSFMHYLNIHFWFPRRIQCNLWRQYGDMQKDWVGKSRAVWVRIFYSTWGKRWKIVTEKPWPPRCPERNRVCTYHSMRVLSTKASNQLQMLSIWIAWRSYSSAAWTRPIFLLRYFLLLQHHAVFCITLRITGFLDFVHRPVF